VFFCLFLCAEYFQSKREENRDAIERYQARESGDTYKESFSQSLWKTRLQIANRHFRVADMQFGFLDSVPFLVLYNDDL